MKSSPQGELANTGGDAEYNGFTFSEPHLDLTVLEAKARERNRKLEAIEILLN